MKGQGRRWAGEGVEEEVDRRGKNLMVMGIRGGDKRVKRVVKGLKGNGCNGEGEKANG